MRMRSVHVVLGLALGMLGSVPPVLAQTDGLAGVATPPSIAAGPGGPAFATADPRAGLMVTPFGLSGLMGLAGDAMMAGRSGLLTGAVLAPYGIPVLDSKMYSFEDGVPVDALTARPAIVPTDPLVRRIQVGPAPLSALTAMDIRSGTAVANVPGIGPRTVRTLGPTVPTAAGPAVRAVDLATGVELLVLPPAAVPANIGELAPARVIRTTPDGVLLDRTVNGRSVVEVLPAQRVFTPVPGGFIPAATLGAVRPGAEVFVPAAGGARGSVIASVKSRTPSRATTRSRRPARTARTSSR